MLSDTLNLFVSWVTDSLTKRSSTRGLGWLRTSLTRKESEWGTTMEVERGWETTVAGASLQPQVSAQPYIHSNVFSENGSRKSCQHSFMNGRNYISLHIPSVSLPFISCLLHFLVFFLPFCHLSRLSQNSACSWIILCLFSLELRLHVVSIVYPSRYEKLFYPIKGLPANYLYS